MKDYLLDQKMDVYRNIHGFKENSKQPVVTERKQIGYGVKCMLDPLKIVDNIAVFGVFPTADSSIFWFDKEFKEFDECVIDGVTYRLLKVQTYEYRGRHQHYEAIVEVKR